MVAGRRYFIWLCSAHLKLILGLVAVCGVAGLTPIALADSPPVTSTDQTTATDPAADTAPPAPDPAPATVASPTTHTQSTPASKTATPAHATAPTRATVPTHATAPADVTPVGVHVAVPATDTRRTTPVVQPSFHPVVAPPSSSTTTRDRPTTPKIEHRTKPATNQPPPSPDLERPPGSSAVNVSKMSGPAAQHVASHTKSSATASVQGTGRNSALVRDFVVVLDAAALLLLVAALIPLAFFHRRGLGHQAVRLRASLAATGISLLSASLILFMLNLSGPIP